MKLEQIRDAIRQNKIDRLVVGAKRIDRATIPEAIESYERYYDREMLIANTINELILRSRLATKEIPQKGVYTYTLE